MNIKMVYQSQVISVSCICIIFEVLAVLTKKGTVLYVVLFSLVEVCTQFGEFIFAVEECSEQACYLRECDTVSSYTSLLPFQRNITCILNVE
jgi:hypothetical protein